MLRTIRLTEERLRDVLDELDAEHAESERSSGVTWYRYRVPALVVHMPQPDAVSPASFIVPGRVISSTGIMLLHGGIVEPTTRCLVQLVTSDGTWSYAAGRVSRAEHVQLDVHEVTIEFDEAIDPARYCVEAARSRVLLVEDDATIARLTKFHLESLNADVEVVEDGRRAVDKALARPYDLILMDLLLPVMDGVEAARQLRADGFSGQIAATSGMTGEDDRARCFDAGCDDYLPEPYTRRQLAMLLVRLSKEPLLSRFHTDPSQRVPVREFVLELPGLIRQVESAIEEAQRDVVREVGSRLKSDACCFGFDIISEVAGEVEQAVADGEPLEQIRQRSADLTKLCMQARAPQ